MAGVPHYHHPVGATCPHTFDKITTLTAGSSNSPGREGLRVPSSTTLTPALITETPCPPRAGYGRRRLGTPHREQHLGQTGTTTLETGSSKATGALAKAANRTTIITTTCP